jgi:ketosteroid isomerase-like protein
VAVEGLRRLHEAQAAFYGGGPSEPLKDLLTPDVVWRVPGDSPIAGVYQGADAVVEYFTRRRDIASGTFTMHPVDVLVGTGERVAALTDGTVIVEGVTRKWSTVGLYRFRAERVAACWLLPLDPREFDFIWTACFRASSEPPPGRARS